MQELRQQEKYGMVFNAGGNQRAGSKNRSGSRGPGRSDSKGARRKWLAPGNEESEPSLTDKKPQNYQNPVSINSNPH